MKARFLHETQTLSCQQLMHCGVARGDPDLKSAGIFHTAGCWIRFFFW